MAPIGVFLGEQRKRIRGCFLDFIGVKLGSDRTTVSESNVSKVGYIYSSEGFNVTPNYWDDNSFAWK